MIMEPLENQGQRLAYARRRAGYRSASAAARALGVPEVTYRAHESGARGLSEVVARTYAHLFHVNWAWLITGDGSIEVPAGHLAEPVTEFHSASALSSQPLSAQAQAYAAAPPPQTSYRGAGSARNLSSRADVDLARAVPADRLVGEKDLPVYGVAEGGPTGMVISYDPIEWVKRPEPLRNVESGFGFYLVGDSMSPRFEHGEMLLVHPTRPPGRHDDVLIIQRGESDGEHYGLVKRFIGWKDDTLLLEQLNPPERLKPIPREKVVGVHMIVGSYRGFR